MDTETRNPEDKRQHRRASLNCNINVFDQQQNRIAAQLVDISGGGAQICTESRITEQAVYQFNISIPDIEIFGEIVFDARCVWSRNGEGDDHCHAGFQLHNVTDEDIERIVWLIDEFGIESD